MKDTTGPNGTLVQLYNFFTDYEGQLVLFMCEHSHTINVLIHSITFPFMKFAIYFTVVVLCNGTWPLPTLLWLVTASYYIAFDDFVGQVWGLVEGCMVGASVLLAGQFLEAEGQLCLLGCGLGLFMCTGIIQVIGHLVFEGRFPATTGDVAVRATAPFFDIITGPFMTMMLLYVWLFEPKEALTLLNEKKKAFLRKDGSGKLPIRLVAYA